MSTCFNVSVNIKLVLVVLMALGGASFLSAGEVKLTASDAEEWDQYGDAVSIYNDVAAVGAFGEDDPGFNSGAVYIYRRSGNDWLEEARLEPPDALSGMEFGKPVSLHGNVLAIGAPGDDAIDDNGGAVYIYRYDGIAWQFEQKITLPDLEYYSRFGQNLDLYENNLIATRNRFPHNLENSAYVFQYNPANNPPWQQQAELTAPYGFVGDAYGSSVAINNNYAIVAAGQDDENGLSSGAAYAYAWNGTHWDYQEKILPDDGEFNDFFGYSMDLDDDQLIIGAFADDDFGSSAGSAYIFQYNGSYWVQNTKLFPADYDEEDADVFGLDVTINDDWAAIGASGDDSFGNGSGAVFIFHRNAGVWNPYSKFFANDTERSDNFGENLSLSDDCLLVGAHFSDDAGEWSGSAYIYDDFQNQPLTIDIDIDANYLPVPAEGDSFPFNMSVTNHLSTQQQNDVWIDMVLPGGTVVPVLTPRRMVLPRGGVLQRSPIMKVIGSGPAGTYEIIARGGPAFGSVETTESIFTFEKLAASRQAPLVSANLETFPQSTGLIGNYPNPFNPTTQIQYALAEAANVRLAVYDIQGREVALLVSGKQEGGYHSAQWNGRDQNGATAASGLYFYRLTVENTLTPESGVYSGKMMLVK